MTIAYDRLLLYFILVLGIIAVSIWTLFFIQNTQVLEKAIENQNRLNLTQFILNETKDDIDRREFATEAIENLTKNIQFQLLDMKGQLIAYMHRDNTTNTNMIENQNTMIELLLQTVEDSQRLAEQHVNDTMYHEKEVKRALHFAEQNVNMTKINKKNIENILNNITALQDKLK